MSINIGRIFPFLIKKSVSSTDNENIRVQKNVTNPINAKNLKPLNADTVLFSDSFRDFSKVEINFSNLSDRVHIKPKGREYEIISMPKSMQMKEVELNGETFEIPLKTEDNGKKCVAVLDSFQMGTSKIAQIGKKENVTHGELVGKMLTNGLENDVEVLGFDICYENSAKPQRDKINQVLDDILEMKKQGTKIDAINLSNAFETDYKTLTNLLKEPVNSCNISELKDKILSACENQMFMKYPYSTIMKINELVKNGIKVYVSAGNERFALETLSDAVVVGGISDSGSSVYPADEPNMPLINHREKAIFNLSAQYENGAYIGLGDENILFNSQEVGNSKNFRTEIKGTSLSTPLKLNKDLKNGNV